MVPEDTRSGGPADERPSARAGKLAFALVASALLAALLIDSGDGFAPRVDTLDALAGLSIGAFIVDRLLTFVPPIVAAHDADKRAIDLTVLRLAWGAAIGALFVVLTNLQAVEALGGGRDAIGEGTDRAIAVFAIAGGVAGLARLWSGINPQPATDVDDNTEKPGDKAAAEDIETPLPPPSPGARVLGVVLVGLGALTAITAIGDAGGVELMGPDAPAADGTVAVVVHFGVLFIAAAIVQQLVEYGSRFVAVAKHDKPVILGGLAVLLGVAVARIFDLYLLHNIGFFGVTKDIGIDKGLAMSGDWEMWGDAFLTGVVIAAGTKPIHDIGARLRKAAAT